MPQPLGLIKAIEDMLMHSKVTLNWDATLNNYVGWLDCPAGKKIIPMNVMYAEDCDYYATSATTTGFSLALNSVKTNIDGGTSITWPSMPTGKFYRDVIRTGLGISNLTAYNAAVIATSAVNCHLAIIRANLTNTSGTTLTVDVFYVLLP